MVNPIIIDPIQTRPIENVWRVKRNNAQQVTSTEPIYRAVASFLKARGIIYDTDDDTWYLFNQTTGIYEKTAEQRVKDILITSLPTPDPTYEHNFKDGEVNNILSMTKSLSNVSALNKEFDSGLFLPDEYKDWGDDLIIPVNNGVINATKGTFFGYCDKFFCPRHYNVDYTQLTDAQLTGEENYGEYEIFRNIFNDDNAMEYFFWWIGSTLFSGKVSKTLLILFGGTDTGKSALSSITEDILGHDQWCSTVSLKQLDDPHGTAAMRDKKLNIFDEAGEDENYNVIKTRTELLKGFTGGNYVTYNQKYKDLTSARNTANMMFCCNSFPRFNLTDAGFQSRLRIMEFTRNQNDLYGTMKLYDYIKTPEGYNWFFNMALKKWLEYGEKGDEILRDKLDMEVKTRYLMTNTFNTWIMKYMEDEHNSPLYNKTTPTPSLDVATVRFYLDHKVQKDVYDHYREFLATSDDYVQVNEEKRYMTKNKFYANLRTIYNLETKESNGNTIFVKKKYH